jgi:hypothetical protein
MTFSQGSIGFVLITVYVFIFLYKLIRFHFFVRDNELSNSRDAIIMSCLSLFLEVFGHVFISLPSAVGFLVYTMNKKFIILVFILSFVTNIGRNFGNKIGRTKFSKYIAPQMRMEGALLSIFLPSIISYLLFLASRYEDYQKYLVVMGYTDYMH